MKHNFKISRNFEVCKQKNFALSALREIRPLVQFLGSTVNEELKSSIKDLETLNKSLMDREDMVHSLKEQIQKLKQQTR